MFSWASHKGLHANYVDKIFDPPPLLACLRSLCMVPNIKFKKRRPFDEMVFLEY